MADSSKIGCDSVRIYHTGAASAGAAQAVPANSLGGFISSNEAPVYDIDVELPITGLSMLYASGNLPRTGTQVKRVDAGNVRLIVAGVDGSNVAIADGDTVQINMNLIGEPEKFARVSRSGAITGDTADLVLTTKLNNLFGMEDVSSADAITGISTYRMMGIKNVSAGTITNLRIYLPQLGTQNVSAGAFLPASGAGAISISTGTFDNWPASGWCRVENSSGTYKETVYYTSRSSTSLTVPAAGRALLGSSAVVGTGTDKVFAVPGIRIGLEDDGVQLATYAYPVIANDNTAPTTVSAYWTSGTDDNNVAEHSLYVASIVSGSILGVWAHEHVPAGAIATTTRYSGVILQYDGAAL
jgi:hypothetical protein